MTEPELLKTLERLENEEPLDVSNPELPLPSLESSEDYLSILQDLRDALGDAEEPIAENPVAASFTDPQNILELDTVQQTAPKTAEFENELELLPEAIDFGFSAEKANAAFSDFELKLPVEDAPAEKPDEMLESQNFEQRDEPELPVSADNSDLFAASETANFEAFTKPEVPPSFIQSSADAIQPEPELMEEADSVSLEDFLSAQEFSRAPQTTDFATVNDSFGSQTEDSAFEMEPPEFFKQFVFEEATEPGSIFDSPVERDEETSPTDFAFVPVVEEDTEFPEILHDEEAEEFASADFAAEETLASDTITDFETESFAPETEDFSAFLPAATRDFLSDLESEPELPEFEAPQPQLEILPEPLLADEASDKAETRSPFVVFKLDTEYFAFPASAVAEIGHEPQFTALPFVPRWFSGVANLRGDVIAVLDLRSLWEMPAAAPDARRKMLVVHSDKESLTIGLLVDAVSEIRYLGESEINSELDFSDQPFAFCVDNSSRMNESVVPLLNVERFLASPKLRRL